MNLLTWLFKFGILTVISGCTYFDALNTSPTKYTTEMHLLKGDINATPSTRTPDDTDLEKAPIFEEYINSFNSQADQSLAEKYMARGINLNLTLCFSHLDALDGLDNTNNFTKEVFLAGTILATGILALDDKTEEIQKLALSTAFGVTLADRLDKHYFLGPDGDVVVDLVKRAMESAEGVIRQSPPKNFDAAFRYLHDYANICTPASIRRLVRSSIQKAEPEANPTASNQDEKRAIEIRASIDKLKMKVADSLSATSISDETLLLIYWAVADGGLDNEEYKEYLANKLKITGFDQTKYAALREIFINYEDKSVKEHLSVHVNSLRRAVNEALEKGDTVAKKNTNVRETIQNFAPLLTEQAGQSGGINVTIK